METSWWTCPGCGVDAELPEVGAVGYEMPCPDCPEAMVLWREGVLAAALERAGELGPTARRPGGALAALAAAADTTPVSTAASALR